MKKTRQQCIENKVTQKKDSIKEIDEALFGDVIGVAQALGQLKEALEKVDNCMSQREFEKASNLGYSDVSSEFIFLQRCLGGLNGTVSQKQIIIQDIGIELCNELDNVSYEEIAPFVDKEIESLQPISQPMKIEVLLGKKTAEKLQSLKNIRQTPIEHIVELILASAMKNDEKYWQDLEKSKSSIPNIKKDTKESYSSDEVMSHLDALSEQREQQIKNLY